MKKNKEKEKNTNPYHKEYGVFSNSIHALKSMLSYSHRFIPVDYGYYAEPLRQLILSHLYRSKIQADGT